jgi:hypothetical protein
MRTFLEAWRRLEPYERMIGGSMIAAIAVSIVLIAWRVAQ